MERSCDKCKSCVSVEEHHIHPRFMDNPNGEGIKIWLCQRCHGVLHQGIIPRVIWAYVQQYGFQQKTWLNKKACIEAVKKRTISWLEEEDEN